MAPRLRETLHLAATCLALLPAGAGGNELPARLPSAGGLRIHPVEEVLALYCVQGPGRLDLALPGGARFELITSVDDPAIANRGDGSFHPFPEAEVRAALGQIAFPVGAVGADVFILPYPRRAGLESAAGPGVILLSPGVREPSREQVHAELAHELGHVVQFALLPDADRAGWDRYRQLRGITDTDLYNESAVHANRPHEIFAEDFRALFGGPLANYSGSLENPGLPLPGQVAGLRGFMEALGQSSAPAAAFAHPNPTRGAVGLVLPLGASQGEVEILDVAGRRVRTLQAEGVGAGRWSFGWDGRNAAGERVAPGAYLVRSRGGAGAVLRLVVLPPS